MKKICWMMFICVAAAFTASALDCITDVMVVALARGTTLFFR